MAVGLPEAALSRTLELVERRELASLRWGYVDGSLAEAEVDAIADGVLRDLGASGGGDLVVEALVKRHLLTERRQPDGSHRLRSRFAEGVRLLSQLRQVFPKRPWQTAPPLVSDFRVDARPRRYPRRDVDPEAAVGQLAAELNSPLRRDLALALLTAAGHSLHLSAFQIRAARAVLHQQNDSHGVVVSAGTGSGKTLAFYLPAFVDIGTWIDARAHWTKAMAVYPRTELLKDQFTEAFRLARRLDAPLVAARKRAISLGTYFGLTPERADPEAIGWAGWQPAGGGTFICPFLLCPECEGEMVWQREDIEHGIERLRCRNTRCHGAAAPEHLTLTRKRAANEPPDVVFTTAEMVNRRLSDTSRRMVLGVHARADQRARLLLLDEIHTYQGSTGAQTALVLRRWRHQIGAPVRLVGLSATLREAGPFFAQLTGLPDSAVQEIEPTDEEMTEQSMAYQVILRGDPVSQTSLLSTSIQASFLLERLLDPLAENRLVDGRSAVPAWFGSRTFVFSDDLDVTNRLFDSLRDAEAYDIFGRPDPERSPLAVLRTSSPVDARTRDVAGQDWRICEEIGWPLDRRLRISRTTSQDAGVASASDVVVATAALEVGFNDPTVGAILQHKSPRELAAFVQRKGRAGRILAMRPWMVTVLSDYGRDRLTYQSYEQLFDPALPPQQLPIRNQYILRMQAVFALLDWLATNNYESGLQGWWWQPANAPARSDWVRRQQRGIQDTLRRLLQGERDLNDSLAQHLAGALQLSKEQVNSLLWEAPRSLMLEVIPTLARRIHAQWRTNPHNPGAVAAPNDLMAPQGRVHPLPDFVPASLFSDLSLPEVTILLPPATKRDDESQQMLPIVQALRHLAPGRVTRRFAFERGGLNHWVPVPLDATTHALPISRFAEQHQFVADVPAEIDGEQRDIPCYRPWAVRVEKISENVVSPTSNASLEWSGQLLPYGDPVSFTSMRPRDWGDLLPSVDAYLHAFRSAVTVRRFATGAVASIRRPRIDTDHVVQTNFVTDEGTPAAIGFEHDVDGLCVQVHLPTTDEFAERAARSKNLPAWRSAYLRDRILQDPGLCAETGWFQRDWIYQIYFSALLIQASHGASLQEASETLHSGEFEPVCQQVMESIFHIGENPDEDTEESRETPDGHQNGGTTRTARLKERLGELLARPSVQQRLRELVQELWAPTPDPWTRWLMARAHESLGDSVLLACLFLAPRHAALDTLLLDLQRAPGKPIARDGIAEIWITEDTLGGAGVVEAIARVLAAEPRAFYRALEAALAPGDLELASVSLDAFVDLATSDPGVRSSVSRVRQEHEHDRRGRALLDLYSALSARGVGVSHALSVALNHRLLRPGTDTTSDQLLVDLLVYWGACEQRLGVAIDLRVFCFLAVSEPSVRPRLQALLQAITGILTNTPAELVAILSGILWPRPSELRARAFDAFNPFRDRGHSEPSFVRDLLLADRTLEIDIQDVDWEERLQAALAQNGAARLAAEGNDAQVRLHAAIYRLIATPVIVDHLHLFPLIEQVQHDPSRVVITLVLQELG